jgi:hypothetical protein
LMEKHHRLCHMNSKLFVARQFCPKGLVCCG